MENSRGRLPDQAIRNRANSSVKGPAHMENTEKIITINIAGWIFTRLVWNRPTHHKWASLSGIYKTKDKQLMLWAGSSSNSSGTGPAHHQEKCQVIWKIVKK